MAGEGEWPKATDDVMPSVDWNQLVPVGSIIAWAKNIPGVPTLPLNYVECNGQTLSDAESVYNGQVIPSLNSTNRFLRGNSSSGSTGGSATHIHTVLTDSHSHGGSLGTVVNDSYDCCVNIHIMHDHMYHCNHVHSVSSAGHTHTVGAGSSEPQYYNAVWIMRVK